MEFKQSKTLEKPSAEHYATAGSSELSIDNSTQKLDMPSQEVSIDKQYSEDTITDKSHDQKLLQIELKGLKGKLEILERSEKSGVTFRQLICCFIFCIMLNLLFNLVVMGFENQMTDGKGGLKPPVQYGDAFVDGQQQSLSEVRLKKELERVTQDFNVQQTKLQDKVKDLESRLKEEVSPVHLQGMLQNLQIASFREPDDPTSGDIQSVIDDQKELKSELDQLKEMWTSLLKDNSIGNQIGAESQAQFQAIYIINEMEQIKLRQKNLTTDNSIFRGEMESMNFKIQQFQKQIVEDSRDIEQQLGKDSKSFEQELTDKIDEDLVKQQEKIEQILTREIKNMKVALPNEGAIETELDEKFDELQKRLSRQIKDEIDTTLLVKAVEEALVASLDTSGIQDKIDEQFAELKSQINKQIDTAIVDSKEFAVQVNLDAKFEKLKGVLSSQIDEAMLKSEEDAKQSKSGFKQMVNEQLTELKKQLIEQVDATLEENDQEQEQDWEKKTAEQKKNQAKVLANIDSEFNKLKEQLVYQIDANLVSYSGDDDSTQFKNPESMQELEAQFKHQWNKIDKIDSEFKKIMKSRETIDELEKISGAQWKKIDLLDAKFNAYQKQLNKQMTYTIDLNQQMKEIDGYLDNQVENFNQSQAEGEQSLSKQLSFNQYQQDAINQLTKQLNSLTKQQNKEKTKIVKKIESLESDIKKDIDLDDDAFETKINSQFMELQLGLTEKVDGIVTQRQELLQNLAVKKAELAIAHEMKQQFNEVKEQLMEQLDAAILAKTNGQTQLVAPGSTSFTKSALAYYVNFDGLSELMAQTTPYFQNTIHKQMWKKLGPVSIIDIVKKTQSEYLFDPFKVDLEIKDMKFDEYRVEGMFKKGTDVPHGIGKQIMFKNTNRLYEGMFIEGQWNGYGRLLWQDGHYYVGEFRYGYYHGQGKLVLLNGQVYEGEWKYSSFIGE